MNIMKKKYNFFIKSTVIVSLLFVTTVVVGKVNSLSDYSFIGSGYGELTTPSTPAPGVQVPYVPDLSNLDASKVVVVSNSTELKNNLSSGKIIVCENGTYDFKVSKTELSNVVLISKNKWGAKITGSGPKFAFSGSGVYNLSIIGFEAIGTGEANADVNLFIKSSSRDAGKTVYNIYISDMKFHEYAMVIYGGLHSYNWTVDKVIHYNSNLSYLWYMMGWHHSVINSVMYNNTRYSIAIRGCFPIDETYYYDDHSKNIRISERSKHFLASNDWTHLIMNNTFGSVYDNSRPSESFVTLYYNATEGEGNKEDVYFPPKNILIANNAFIDNGGQSKYPFKIFANRGVNTGAIDAVNGVFVKNNYTDKDKFLTSDYSNHQIDLSTNHLNVSESSMGFDDSNRDYTITKSSVLANAGSKNLYITNIDNTGETRDNIPDVGAFEVPGSTPGTSVDADFTYSKTDCSASVIFTDKSTSSEGSIDSYLWKFGDGKTSTVKSPIYVYSSAGTYSVELTVSKNSVTDTKTSVVVVSFAEKPIVVDGSRTSAGQVDLSASVSDGGSINWYSASSGGEILATGNSFKTPYIDKTTYYYAENKLGGATPKNVGKLSKGADGNYYAWEDDKAKWGLEFDAMSDFTLKSVKVWNGNSSEGSYVGSRTFTVFNSGGDVVATTTVNVIDGEQRLDLNMQIPTGSGYRLVSDAHKGFWRDTKGASYPYEINGMVKIKNGIRYDGTKPDDLTAYYFFYDWVVSTGSVGCVSDRVQAKATIGTVGVDDITTDISIYPNPSNGKFNVNIGNSVNNLNISIYDIYGKQVSKLSYEQSENILLDLTGLPQGVYLLNITDGEQLLKIEKVTIVN